MSGRKSLGSVLGSITFVVLAAALSAWQFYRFATFPEVSGINTQGGSVHLWLAIGLAVIACVAGFFVFSVFLRYDRDDEMHITFAAPRELLRRDAK
jgi:hypothetical protein